MGSLRAWVLILITTSVSNGDVVTLKGDDLVYKPANSEAPRALLVNESGNPVQSVATDAFTACLFAKLDSYEGLKHVHLFSFSSRRNNQVDEIVIRLQYFSNQTYLYIRGYSTSIDVAPPLDEWMHICVSWESISGTARLHVNGVRVGKDGTVQPGYILGGEGYFVLGQDQNFFNDGFYPQYGVHGMITQFHLWNRVLTTNEVNEVQSCKLEGNVVNWSNSYWTLEGSLYRQKSSHLCGIVTTEQGCECVKSVKEEFQNLLLTYKAEFQDGLNKTAQTINDVEKEDGRAQQAITELTQRLELKENDITSLKNATLFLELRSTKNELEVCHQKEAIDECKQRVNSLDQSLRSEILVQKQAIDECDKRLSSLDQSLKSEISSLIAEINAIKAKTNAFACPTQFINLNGQCYYFSTYEADWDQALKDCQTLDSRASLLTMENSEEWSAIKTHIDQGSNGVWWTGGSDTQSEGNWIWTSTNKPLSADAWCPGEPNNAGGNEGCLVISKICWNDLICSAKFAFICKIGETKVNSIKT